MRLLSWNVNELRAIYRKGFLDWLMKDSPDVLCIQETRLREYKVPGERKSCAWLSLIFFRRRQEGLWGSSSLYTQ